MHATPSMGQSDSPFRGLLVTAFTYRRRILVTAVVVLGLALALAAALKSKYAAHASLLTLLGTEYTYRPVAGQAATSNGSLEREQVLRTEIEILESDDLHRALIRRIGLERLYPDYLEPPGLVMSAVKFVLGLPARVAASVTGAEPEKPLDPVELALLEFNDSFSAVAVKAGNSIELTFTHQDPGLAAEALNTLDAMYLDLRKSVFTDQQSGLVEAQVGKLRDALAAADAQLADFKRDHDISAFQTRREIVLHAQGDAEKDQADAASAVGQGEARIAALRAQLARLPATVQSGQDTDVEQRLTPLRASLDGLRARETELRAASYREDSAPVRAVREQIAAREAELAAKKGDRTPSGYHVAPNPLREAVGGDLLRAQADLDAARVRRAHAQAVLEDLAAQLRALNEQEQQLDQLDRQRQVADDAYRGAAKVLEERRITDAVEARKQASVRVVQPATVPIKAKPTRKLIVLGGFVLALFSAAFAAILSNFLRESYLTAGELESDLGVAVLAAVPERAASTARALALRVAHA